MIRLNNWIKGMRGGETGGKDATGPQGPGAPTEFKGLPKGRSETKFALAALLACLAGCLFASAPAFAEFSRPFLREIKGTPTGEHGALAPFFKPEGIAVDPNNNDVYVGQPLEGYSNTVVNLFDSSDAFVEQLTGFAPNSLAYDDKSGKLESSREWVAADNSTNPATRGDVYFASDGRGSGTPSEIPPTVARFNEGKPADFTCSAPGAENYIKGNELTGTPTETWRGQFFPVGGVAIDSSSGASAGYIYVLTRYNHKQVDQFTSAGCFVQEFKGAGVPGGFGEVGNDDLAGITVDPTTGDVLVSEPEHYQLGAFSGVIDEFTPSFEYLGRLTGFGWTRNAENRIFRALNGDMAVNSVGDLYVSDEEKKVVDEFGPGAFYPSAVTGEVTDDQPEVAMLNGVVRGTENSKKEDLELSGCEFEYVTEAAFQKSVSEGMGGFSVVESKDRVPCVPSFVGQRLKETENYSVHAEATGLKSGEVYDYRLVATANPSEHGGTKDGDAETFAAAHAPAVEAESVGDVSSSFADFSAKIDPLGSDTTYRFEYVAATGYEAAVAEGAADPYAAGASVPVPAADIGSGDRSVSVSAQAAGLSPYTSYHYRVVASNGVGVAAGADEVFATEPVGLQGLPDGRAYELVTPANKGDAEDMFERINILDKQSENPDVGYASEDGEHFLLFTKASFGPFPASGGGTEEVGGGYVFSRGATGWSFQSVASPSLSVQAVRTLIFDPLDFSVVGVEDLVTTTEGARQPTALVGSPGTRACEAPTSSGCFSTAVSGMREEIQLAGASEDLSHVVVEDKNRKLPLCESDQEAFGKEQELDEGSSGLYEWSAGQRCLSLVDVKSRSEGGKVVSKCGAELGLGTNQERASHSHNAVSADGSKIFFTAPGTEAEGRGCYKEGSTHDEAFPPELYMRVSGETTAEVSAPEGGEAKATHPAMYVGAAENGSKVFFMTHGELTKEAVKLKTHEQELYEYDTEAPEGERLVRVSRGDLESGPVEGKVLDVPTVSADGSTVYFNAEGNLTPEAHGGGLYRYDTETGETAYVAPAQGYPPWSAAKHGERTGISWYNSEVKNNTLAGLDVEAPYYTTRDGRFLLYGPYRYDAATGSSVCVMCNPDGSGPIPEASFTRSAVETGNPAGRPTRGMTEDGECVFFDTAESLVPQATNGRVDVYEWEAHGAHGCKPVHSGGCELAQGCTYLISSGQDPHNSYFLDSSPYVNAEGETVEGGNIFFGTHANLVPSIETASEGNLYDARIGGGFQTSAGAGLCEGDACDNSPPAPIDQTPASLTFSGAGNVPSKTTPKVESTTKKTTKCPKGRKLSHGRCAKKKMVGKKAKKARKASSNRRADK